MIDPTRESCVSLPEVVLRRFAHSAGSLLPDELQYKTFVWLKRVKGRIRRRDSTLLMNAWEGLRQAPTVECPPMPGFAVTHDVDYKGCYDFIPQLLDLDDELGIKATYNFLTHAGYTPGSSILTSIQKRGHEIGLHGKNHDRALGSRSDSTIREFLTTSRNMLQELSSAPVTGFRAPALALSPRLLSILDEMGFTHDSSTTTCGLCSSYTTRASPHRPPGLTLTEIPLTIQDSQYINDIPLTPDAIQLLYRRVLRLTDAAGVPVLANFHPVIAKSHTAAYRQAIHLLNERNRPNILLASLVLPSLSRVSGQP